MSETDFNNMKIADLKKELKAKVGSSFDCETNNIIAFKMLFVILM